VNWLIVNVLNWASAHGNCPSVSALHPHPVKYLTEAETQELVRNLTELTREIISFGSSNGQLFSFFRSLIGRLRSGKADEELLSNDRWRFP
jgi:hypothetical protein